MNMTKVELTNVVEITYFTEREIRIISPKI